MKARRELSSATLVYSTGSFPNTFKLFFVITLPLILPEGFKVRCEMSCVPMSLIAVHCFWQVLVLGI